MSPDKPAREALTTPDKSLPWLVQYRVIGSVTWHDMAAFDVEGAAERYAASCAEHSSPWEYRTALRTPAEETEAVAYRYEKNGKTFINQHHQPWKAEQGWTITPLYPTTPPDEAKVRVTRLAQFTICEDCGKSDLYASDAVWADDGSAFCPACRAPSPAPAVDEKQGWDVEYEVTCDGEWAATSTSLSDARHYARVYGQDGLTEIIEVRRRALEDGST